MLAVTKSLNFCFSTKMDPCRTPVLVAANGGNAGYVFICIQSRKIRFNYKSSQGTHVETNFNSRCKRMLI